MINKSGKRAVIINNTHSDSIEQAIFILKAEKPCRSVGSGIISEAQEIINSYINKVEGIPYRPRRGFRHKKAVLIASVAAAVLTVAVSILLKI